MRRSLTLSRIAAVCSLAVLAVACGSDDSATDGPAAGAPSETIETADTAGTADAPTIVVTTNILGDIVSETVGDLAEVEVIMPVGSDPHDFAPSARQAESMENADLLVTNGAGFEEGMIDIIELVESSGTPVFAFADQIELLEFAGYHDEVHSDEVQSDEGHSDEVQSDEGHSDEVQSDEEHSDDVQSDDVQSDEVHSDEEQEHSGDDPHIWTDPARMVVAVEAFGVELATLEGIDADAVETQVQAYVDQLISLDAEMEETLSSVPEENRVLVTNHEVFGYFADRFDFEVVGAVIPSLTTSAEPSTAEVEALVELIEQEQIPAIFGDTSGSTRLAEVIAESAGNEVAVVVLFSESLGDPESGADTYITMMTSNSTLIANALTPA